MIRTIQQVGGQLPMRMEPSAPGDAGDRVGIGSSQPAPGRPADRQDLASGRQRGQAGGRDPHSHGAEPQHRRSTGAATATRSSAGRRRPTTWIPPRVTLQGRDRPSSARIGRSNEAMQIDQPGQQKGTCGARAHPRDTRGTDADRTRAPSALSPSVTSMAASAACPVSVAAARTSTLIASP